jgi:aspartate racemase
MTGPVYASALRRRGSDCLVPDSESMDEINRLIFDELCQGIFRSSTTKRFVSAIEDLRAAGADCVILGCTEIPLILSDTNSPLPVLDSTRLLARHAVREAANDRPLTSGTGWLSRSM